MRSDDGGEFWHIVAGALVGAVLGGVGSIIAQAISGQEINWGAVAIAAGSGAISGAINAAFPCAGAVATGLIQGTLSAGEYIATETLAYGRDVSVEDVLKVGITSGVTAGVTKYIGQEIGAVQCFIAGTPVLTQNGYVPIEEILPGDLVWATDPETGETALKEVVQLFRNETDEWMHVSVNGEEIVCTPSHPFYSPVKGWTKACHLRAGDILVTVNGEYVVVEKIEHELLENPETTYNFEVKDFHTYYVGSAEVLVHNSCKHNSQWNTERRNYWKQTSKIVENSKNYGSYVATTDNIDRMAKGLAPIGWDGFSVQLHHWNGIANDFYNYSPVSKTLHQIIHSLR